MSPLHKDTDRRLAELRAREEEELMRMLSKKYGLEYVDLSNVSIDANALRLVPEDQARAAGVAGFKRTGKAVAVAVRSPQKAATRTAIEELAQRGYSVTQYLASSASLERAWGRYSELSHAVESKAGVLDISTEDIRKTIQEMNSIEKVAEHIRAVLSEDKAYRISRIVEIIIAGGLALGASDIHIEPAAGEVRLRMRLDGVLSDVGTIDSETYELLRSRIKLLAKMRLNIHDEAQDGRFSIELDTKEIEIRASILPGSEGESIVLRLLDPETIALSLEELGMDGRLLELTLAELKRPNGMILTTGPTGSGKTTTLYAFMRKVHTPGIKIITIEDPIEYHLKGIVQTQADNDEYTFSSGLRSAVRQDPDVIMVGEIRDQDVAETAINAALTGHLVFSTLHTNSAAGTFPRLIEFGVDPNSLGSAINIALAQRLVRRLCESCKKRILVEGETKQLIDAILANLSDSSRVPSPVPEYIFTAGGCEQCNDTGYAGRIGLFEGILMDAKIEELVRTNPSEREIALAAREQKILTMAEIGILKLLAGTTSLSELERVVDLTEAAARATIEKTSPEPSKQ